MDVCNYKGYNVPLAFMSSMEATQFVDSYVVKKTKFLEQHNKMQAPGIHLSCICQFVFQIMSSYKHSFLFNCCHLKTCEVTHGCLAYHVCRRQRWITIYIAMGLILKVMPSTLALYQMVGFLIEFNITNITTWLDLSFDQVKQLFKNLQNNNAQLSQVIKKIDVPNSNTTNVPHPNVLPSATKPSRLKGENVTR